MAAVTDIEALLARRMRMSDVGAVVRWALDNERNRARLCALARSEDDRLGANALWCLSHLPRSEAPWLQSLQNELIDMLLVETQATKKRILLKLLREQSYAKDDLRVDFIDYCFFKINSECEASAVRCFCIYCAFKMCRFYPELMAELGGYLDMLAAQSLKPGLRCALRTVRENINQLNDK